MGNRKYRNESNGNNNSSENDEMVNFAIWDGGNGFRDVNSIRYPERAASTADRQSEKKTVTDDWHPERAATTADKPQSPDRAAAAVAADRQPVGAQPQDNAVAAVAPVADSPQNNASVANNPPLNADAAAATVADSPPVSSESAAGQSASDAASASIAYEADVCDDAPDDEYFVVNDTSAMFDEDDSFIFKPPTENLDSYIEILTAYRTDEAVEAGAMVLSCEPFTNGHRYLIEYAAARVGRLYCFIADGGNSEMPFGDRLRLACEGTADLRNVTIIPGNKHAVSRNYYASVFEQSDDASSLDSDIQTFATRVAPALDIKIRFTGGEPPGRATRDYNSAMIDILPQYGIAYQTIPKSETMDAVDIDAKLREYIEEQRFDKIRDIVPPSTLTYLREKFEIPVIGYKMKMTSEELIYATAAISGFGGNIFDFFRREGVRKLYIYGDGIVSGLLGVAYGMANDVQVAGFIGAGGKRKLNAKPFPINISYIGVDKAVDHRTPVLVTESINPVTFHKLKYHFSKIYFLDDVCVNEYYKTCCIDRILDITRSAGAGLMLVYGAAIGKNPSAYESWLAKALPEIATCGALKRRSIYRSIFENVYAKYGYDRDYFTNCIAPMRREKKYARGDLRRGSDNGSGYGPGRETGASVTGRGTGGEPGRETGASVTVVSDCSGDYVNCAGGMRRTDGLWAEATSNIYLIGDSVAFGVGADDGGTVASHLQRMIKERQPENIYKYNVLNCANSDRGDVHEIPLLLRSLPLRQDDVVICLISYPPSYPQLALRNYEKLAHVCDVRPYFERPHELGEIFADDAHMNSNGYCQYAQAIYDALVHDGLIQKPKTAMSLYYPDGSYKIPDRSYMFRDASDSAEIATVKVKFDLLGARGDSDGVSDSDYDRIEQNVHSESYESNGADVMKYTNIRYKKDIGFSDGAAGGEPDGVDERFDGAAERKDAASADRTDTQAAGRMDTPQAVDAAGIADAKAADGVIYATVHIESGGKLAGAKPLPHKAADSSSIGAGEGIDDNAIVDAGEDIDDSASIDDSVYSDAVTKENNPAAAAHIADVAPVAASTFIHAAVAAPAATSTRTPVAATASTPAAAHAPTSTESPYVTTPALSPAPASAFAPAPNLVADAPAPDPVPVPAANGDNDIKRLAFEYCGDSLEYCGDTDGAGSSDDAEGGMPNGRADVRNVAGAGVSDKPVPGAVSDPELFEYLVGLSKYARDEVTRASAVIFSGGPFTNGHRHLAEGAAALTQHVYVFIAEDEKSVFSFSDRLKLAEEGVRHIKNATVIPGGRYVVTPKTIESCLAGSGKKDRPVDISSDLEVFARYIAPALNITAFYTGDEIANDTITAGYDSAMKSILPRYGVEYCVIPKREYAGVPISSTWVRSLLRDQRFSDIERLVPPSTLEFLKEMYAIPSWKSNRNGFK